MATPLSARLNSLYFILGNICHPFSMSLHSVLLFKQQISFARMVQLWRAGNGILILTSLSEQRPRHDVRGIGFVETCNPFSMLVCAFCYCWILVRWWKSFRPPPPRDFQTPQTQNNSLFAVCFVVINVWKGSHHIYTTHSESGHHFVHQAGVSCLLLPRIWRFGVAGKKCDGDTADGSEIRWSPPGIKTTRRK